MGGAGQGGIRNRPISRGAGQPRELPGERKGQRPRLRDMRLQMALFRLLPRGCELWLWWRKRHGQTEGFLRLRWLERKVKEGLRKGKRKRQVVLQRQGKQRLRQGILRVHDGEDPCWQLRREQGVYDASQDEGRALQAGPRRLACASLGCQAENFGGNRSRGLRSSFVKSLAEDAGLYLCDRHLQRLSELPYGSRAETSGTFGRSRRSQRTGWKRDAQRLDGALPSREQGAGCSVAARSRQQRQWHQWNSGTDFGRSVTTSSDGRLERNLLCRGHRRGGLTLPRSPEQSCPEEAVVSDPDESLRERRWSPGFAQ